MLDKKVKKKKKKLSSYLSSPGKKMKKKYDFVFAWPSAIYTPKPKLQLPSKREFDRYSDFVQLA